MSMMAETQIVERMKEHIVHRFDPLRVVPFGSHARGNAGPDSDVDLLVVLPEVRNKRQAAIEIRRALSGFHAPKDIIVTSPEEISRRGDLNRMVGRSTPSRRLARGNRRGRSESSGKSKGRSAIGHRQLEEIG